ncbi:unnamed protein product [Effrenium voratum]|nr:unnamed protein product [Effrenium voratum]
MARRDLLLALASGAAGAALFGLLSRWAKRARRGHGAAWLKAEAGSGDRPRVALVAAGSVAAVKVPELATRLADELGAQVAVVLTGGGRFMTSSEIAGRYAREHFVAFEAALRAKRDVFLLEETATSGRAMRMYPWTQWSISS